MTPDTISATEVIARIRDATDLPVHLEHTGGGCATIYVGTPDENHRYALAIGPGEFGSGGVESKFFLEDLFIGPDDDGDADASGPFTQAGQITAAVRRELRPTVAELEPNGCDICDEGHLTRDHEAAR